MGSSRRYSHHLERSTSVGDIGSSLNSGLCIDDDYIPKITKKKFQPQPTIMKPSQTTNTKSKDSKPAERWNATRLSQDPSELSQTTNTKSKDTKPAEPLIATRLSQDPAESSHMMNGVLSHVSAANSVSKEEEQHRTRSRPRVIEGIFFVSSLERELAAAKKIEEDGELGLFGEFIKKCTLCKKEFKPDNNVYRYSDRPFCSSDCRDDQLALDGFSRKDFGLGKEDQKMMKSLKKDLNQLQMYL